MKSPRLSRIESASHLSESFLRNSAKYRIRKVTDSPSNGNRVAHCCAVGHSPARGRIRAARRGTPFLTASHLLFGASVAFVLIAFTACSGEAPAIESVRYSLIAIDDRDSGQRYESLSLFGHISDRDGISDIEYLELRHAGSELSWSVRLESAAIREWDNRIWIGADRLLPSYGDSMPRGEWDLIVSDLGGRQAQSRFNLRSVDFSLSEAQFPQPIHTSDGISIAPAGDDLYLIFEDDAGNQIDRRSFGDERVSRQALDEASQEGASRYWIAVHNRRSSVWLISGPWAI